MVFFKCYHGVERRIHIFALRDMTVILKKNTRFFTFSMDQEKMNVVGEIRVRQILLWITFLLKESQTDVNSYRSGICRQGWCSRNTCPQQGPSAFEEVVINDLIPFIDTTLSGQLQTGSTEQWLVFQWEECRPFR